MVYSGTRAGRDGGSAPVSRPSSPVSASMAGLWKATSVFTRRTITPASDQSAAICSTAPWCPEMTVDVGEELMAATTSVRSPRRRAASSNGSCTSAMAP